jgi:uncharacterized protein (TIGR00251 family)
VSSLELKASPDGVTFPVRVVPRSSRTELAGVMGGTLRVRITAPPVEGAANKALVRFLAKRLGVGRSQVAIVAGKTSRNKVIAVYGLGAADVAHRLLAEG